jgi:hypothetical protein
MKVLLKRCAGLDVHKETVVACARRMVRGRVEQVIEQFGTTTSELLRLADWLLAQGCRHAALEAHADELPHMEVVRPELVQMLEEARNLVIQLNALTASKQDTRRRLLQVIRSGEGMVDVMRTAARQRFGPDSEILVQFGVRPLRSRSQTAEPTTPTPENPESPTPMPQPE